VRMLLEVARAPGGRMCDVSGCQEDRGPLAHTLTIVADAPYLQTRVVCSDWIAASVCAVFAMSAPRQGPVSLSFT
jgi:hypothetical protein